MCRPFWTFNRAVYICWQLCEMPWRQIFTSGPVWAIIVANFCVDWGLYTYLTNIPTFYFEVLFFDIKSVTIKRISGYSWTQANTALMAVTACFWNRCSDSCRNGCYCALDTCQYSTDRCLTCCNRWRRWIAMIDRLQWRLHPPCKSVSVNPFTANPVKALHFAMLF